MEPKFEFNEFGVCTNPETVFEAKFPNHCELIEISKYRFNNKWEYSFWFISRTEGFVGDTKDNYYTPNLQTVIAKFRAILQLNPTHPCKNEFLLWADTLQKPTLF